jgi:hypothetical protein
VTIGEGVSSSSAGERITDGQGGDISCSVILADGDYTVAVQASADGTLFMARATINRATGEGTGSVTLSTPLVGTLSSRAGGCTFSTVTGEGAFQISAGLVWGAFSCPRLGDAASPSLACAIYDGVIAFDNCAK